MKFLTNSCQYLLAALMSISTPALAQNTTLTQELADRNIKPLTSANIDAAGGDPTARQIGTNNTAALANKQALNSTLTSLSNLSTATDQCIYWATSSVVGLYNCSSFTRSLAASASDAAARSALGMGSLATQSSSGVSITGGTVTGITDLAVADGGTGASTSTTARANLAAAADAGAVSVIDYNVSGSTDWTAAFNAALATGHNVIMPEKVGGYLVSDKITIVGAGQRIIGAGPYKSYFHITSAFNMSASSVISIATARDSAAGLQDIGFIFDQPSFTGRSGAIQYPWAIAFAAQSRVYLGGIIRITGAWNGINATGDSGGLSADELQLGALNVGLAIDGAADFVTIRHLGCWPYGFQDASRLQAWGDSTTTCFSAGRIDGLAIGKLSTFQGRVVFAKGADNNVAFGTIDSLMLDGNWARVDASAGYVGIGTWYKSSSVANDYSFNFTGGGWRLGQYRQFFGTTGTTPYINVTNANVTVGSGETASGSPNAPVFSLSGGTLVAASPFINYGTNTTRTVAFVQQTGGQLSLTNPRFAAIGTGSGSGVSIATNTANEILAMNMNGWGVTLPSALSSGSYAFDTVFTSTPTATFQTAGTAAFTYTTQSTRYKLLGRTVQFRTYLAFSTNAFTGASGAFTVTPNIPVTPAMTGGLTLTDVSNVSFSGQLSGYLNSSGQVLIRSFQSGQPVTNLDPSNIPPSSSSIATGFAGSFDF